MKKRVIRMYRFEEYRPPQILRGHLKLGGRSPSAGALSVNSLYLERDGKPWIPVMGEFHFSRYRRREWYRELCKMRAGGVTVVSTYLFWIYHEEQEGVFDFSGDNDLRAFVSDCGRAGMDVILRIGPWAHGECRNGGLPDWLLQKPYPVRENDPLYLEKVRLLYTQFYQQAAGMLYADGGNIIGIQLENEYVHNASHLMKLKELAMECGFRVPLYTVTGWNSAAGAKIPVDEVLPLFGGYCDAPWDNHLRENPPSCHYAFNPMRNDTAIGADQLSRRDADGWELPYDHYPFATCELGGGLQNTHHRRYIVQPMDIYAMALVSLGSGCNLPGYYMYHGGANRIGKLSTFQESKATGYPNDYAILSYDFQAPLSEYGEVRGHYRLLNLLHLFLRDFGESLAPMAYTGARDGESLRYAMRTDGSSGFVFVNHYVRRGRLPDVAGAVIEARGVAFPPLDIAGDTAFFLPFRLPLGREMLLYATAQPLCREEDAWFFVEIPGIRAEYRFENEDVHSVSIVTLPWKEAQYLRRLPSGLYLGDGCDLYEADGEICCAEEGDFSYRKWENGGFRAYSVRQPFTMATLAAEAVDRPPFVPDERFAAELAIGGARNVTWKRLTVTGTQGMVSICDAGDVTQLYVDGKPAADNYYYGVEWRVPASLLAGHECYLAVSEMRDDFYREF